MAQFYSATHKNGMDGVCVSLVNYEGVERIAKEKKNITLERVCAQTAGMNATVKSLFGFEGRQKKNTVLRHCSCGCHVGQSS